MSACSFFFVCCFFFFFASPSSSSSSIRSKEPRHFSLTKLPWLFNTFHDVVGTDEERRSLLSGSCDRSGSSSSFVAAAGHRRRCVLVRHQCSLFSPVLSLLPAFSSRFLAVSGHQLGESKQLEQRRGQKKESTRQERGRRGSVFSLSLSLSIRGRSEKKSVEALTCFFRDLSLCNNNKTLRTRPSSSFPF